MTPRTITFQKKRYKTASSKWFVPYRKIKGRDRTTFKSVVGKHTCGVYVIRSKSTHKILYVGYSGTQLEKTLYRHYQKFSKPKQSRWIYPKYTTEVMVIITKKCDFKLANLLEGYYRDTLKPLDRDRGTLAEDVEVSDFSNLPQPRRWGRLQPININMKFDPDAEAPF